MINKIERLLSFIPARKGKNTLLFLLLIGVISFVFPFLTIQKVSAAPGIRETINFQGKLVDDDGFNVADDSYSIVFSLYDVSSGGSPLWQETRSVSTVDGIFREELGTSVSLSGVNFNSDSLYLGIKVGADAEMSPRVRFTASPYAFQARNVAWSGLQDALSNLALSMGSYTSTFTYGNSTGTNDLFKLTDTVSNSGTGRILSVQSASGSAINPFHVSAGGVEAIIVDSSGYVGIGTTDPTYKLDVNGDIRVASGSELYSNGSATLGNRTYTEQNYVTNAQTFTASINALDMQVADIVGGAGGVWTRSGGALFPTTLTDSVGIGRSAPVALLDVAGTTWLRGGTGNTTGLFVNGSGNVGIGTTSPGAALGINGDILLTNGSNRIISVDFTSGGEGKNLSIKAGGGSVSGGSLYLAGGGTVNGAGNVYVQGGYAAGSDSYANVYLGYDGGNVGIGTTNPGYKLDVNGDIRIASGSELYSFGSATLGNRTYTTPTYVSSGQTFTASIQALDNAVEGIVAGSGGVWTRSGGALFPTTLTDGVGIGRSAPVALLDVAGTTWLRGGTGNTTGLFVNSSGNVGIGTTNPTRALHITNAGGVTMLLENTNAPSGNQVASIFNGGSTGNLSFGRFSDGGAGSTRTDMVIDATTGNVGIGTTNPGARLDVVGSGTADGVRVSNNPSDSSGSDGLYIAFNPNQTTSAAQYYMAEYIQSRPTIGSGISASGYMRGHASSILGATGFSGTLSTMEGYYSQTGLYTGATGTISDAYGFRAHMYRAGAGTITNSYGLYIAPVSSGSTVINDFGVYVDSSTMKNYFGGNVGIGTTDPLSELFIGSTSPSGTSASTGAWDSYRVGIVDTFTYASVDDEHTAFLSDLTLTSTSNNSEQASANASSITIPVGNTVNHGILRTVWSNLQHRGTGTVSNARLFNGELANNSTGIISSANTFNSVVRNTGGGTISDLRYINLLDIVNTSGAITNTYGVYIGDITSGTQPNTPFSIYASDSNAFNYFGGNVGIGTTNPGSALEVAGQVKITGGSPGANKVLTSDANGLATWQSLGAASIAADSLDFTEFKDAMALDALTKVDMAGYNFGFYGTGNVGIGTSSPTMGDIADGIPRLHVTTSGTSGVLNYPVMRISGGPDADNSGGTLVINHSNDRGIYLTGGRGIGNQAVGRIGLINNSGVMSDVISLIEGGNVGIGTTSPSSRLTISSNTAYQTPGSGNNLHIIGANDTTARVTIDAHGDSATSFLPVINFRKSRGTASSPTASQANDVLGELSFYGFRNSSFSTEGKATIGGFAAENWSDTNQGTYIAFRTTEIGTTTRAEQMRISDLGYVGIGTTSPVAKLDVAGTTWLRGGTGNTTGLFVNGSGNVGIGTTNPGAKLDVQGAIHMLEASSSDNNSPALTANNADDFLYNTKYINRYAFGFHQPAGGSTGAYVSGYYGVDLFTTGSDPTMSLRSGSVGIGTTSPGSPLHILTAGTASTQTILLTLGSNTSSRPVLQFSESVGTGLSTGMSVEYDGRGSGSSNKLNINDIAGSPVVTFLSGGDVGIGTTSPTSKLDVLGSTWLRGGTGNTTGLYVNTSGLIGIGTTNPAEKLTIQEGKILINNNAYPGSSNGLYLEMNSTDNNIYMVSKNGNNLNLGTDNSVDFTIKTGGNVGIGTTAPNSKLELYALSGTSEMLTLYNDFATTNNNGIIFNSKDSGGTKRDFARIVSTRSGAQALLNFQIDSDTNLNTGVSLTDALTIAGGGNVGIGTTNPSSLLSVGGTNQFQISSSGVVTSGTWQGGVISSTYLDSAVILSSEIDTYAELNAIVSGVTLTHNGLIDTSSEIAGIVTDETGSGALVFGTNPTFTGGITTGTVSNGSGTVLLPSYTFTGDTNMGIYRPAADVLGFVTSGTERFRVAANGSIGIGTTNPSSLLSVGGTNQFQISSSGVVTSGTWQGDVISSTYLDSAVILSSEIDTYAELNAIVSGVTLTHNGLIDTSSEIAGIVTDETGSGALVFGTNPTFTGGITTGTVSNGSGTVLLPSYTFTGDTNMGIYRPAADVLGFVTSGTERFRVAANGSIGIGTTNPTSLFSVGATNQFQVSSSGVVTSGTWQGGVISSTYLDSAVILSSEIDTYAELNAIVSGVTLTHNGLIDTSSEIAGIVTDETGSGALVFGTNPTFTGGITTGTVSNGSGTVLLPSYTFTGDTNMGIYRPAADVLGFVTSGTERFRVAANGSIGIGTTNPSSLLSVGATNQFQISSSGVVTSGTWQGGVISSTYLDSAVILSSEIDTYAELNAIVSGVTLTHNGLIDTSSEIAGIVTDETGSGALVFGTNPTFTGGITTGTVSNGSGTVLLPSYTFTGDTNMGIYRPAADVLGFVTSGTERFRVAANGSIGIGTTNPTSLFSVGATNQFQVSSSGVVTSGTWQGGVISSTYLDSAVILSSEIDTYAELNAIVSGVTLTHNGLIDTSSEIAGIVTDETGSGALVFGTNPTFTGGITTGTVSNGSGTVLLPSYTFTGDTNMGIYRPAADVLGFVTSGTERFRVAANGSIGIGTTNPSSLLSVGATNQFQISSSGVVTSGTWQGGVISSTYLDSAVILSSEIDTYAELNAIVSGVTLTHNGLIDTSSEIAGIVTDETGSGALVFGTNPTFTGGITTGTVSNGSGTVLLPSYTFTGDTNMGIYRPAADVLGFVTSGTERFRVAANGSIGIGTTSPTSLLHVVGLAGQSNLLSIVDSSNNAVLSATSSKITSAVPHEFLAAGDVSMANDLIFANQSNANIKSNGPLKITAGEVFESQNLTLKTYNSGKLIVESSNVWSDGTNLGIGTTNPLYKLDVLTSGTGPIARFNSSNTTGCTLATGGTISCTSDARLKKNITAYNGGLEFITSLKPVRYNWHYETNGDLQTTGFLSQDVELLDQKLVMTDDRGYKQLNMVGLIPFAVEAIQEQQGMILEITDQGEVLSAVTQAQQNDITLQQGHINQINIEKNVLAETVNSLTDTIQALSTRLENTEQALSETQTDVENIDSRVAALEEFFSNITASDSAILFQSPTASTSAQIARSITETDVVFDKKIVAEDDLSVLGTLSASDIAVVGKISNGILDINGYNDETATPSATITTFGGELRLQHTGMNGIEMVAGKVKVDINGNVLVYQGTVEIAEGDLAIRKGSIKGSESIRGIDITVPEGSLEYRVTFGTRNDTSTYAVSVLPSWFAATIIEEKTEDGFIIRFNQPAPAHATIDWIIIE